MSGDSDITKNPVVSHIIYNNRSFMVRIMVSVCTCKYNGVCATNSKWTAHSRNIYLYWTLHALDDTKLSIFMEHSLHVFDNVSFHSTNSQIFYSLNVKMAKSLSAIMVS